MTQLLNILSKINSIPNINLGGCGIVAIAIYRWLKKNHFNECTYFLFLYLETDEYDYLNNTNTIYTKEVDKVSAPRHMIICNGNIYLDSHGMRDISAYTYKHIIFDEKIIIALINDITKWNEIFDRSNVKAIENLLGIDLSDIKCNINSTSYV